MLYLTDQHIHWQKKQKLEEIEILLDENIIEIKDLVNETDDLSKITCNKKYFFNTTKVTI